MSKRTLFVKLSESEVLQIRSLSKEFHIPMEEVVRRMVIHSVEQLAAEGKAAEDLPAGERQRRAYDEAVKLVEKWEPEF